mmetsp:Transcript_20986/g.51390  ORF Transcript_20986/g.51390 Transcript_20986/m.51390 type:complete len:115 (+) Transcript_20986:159-503(+)|eukprot:CAMPEP_0114491086 /NCGR_PEP_ID=MMETSP0109-20121206/2807_1 /TAXON_ID=29199 /ORGANISM="Chlorarachnion reptans, Strain CCCM449" /LENGTH=114 /DNA_ID=CAMNT_0001667785 /DNA_START=136 /DNA_END=480 /DNA_ORIENTATION=+
MSWDAYCNFPSASAAMIAGIDGTQWGKKADWKSTADENKKLSKASIGSMVTCCGIKFMMVNVAEGVTFGVKGDNAVVVLCLKKCFLAGVGPKAKQGALIDEITKFADSLKKGGY